MKMTALRYLLTSNFPQEGSAAIGDYLRQAGVVGTIAWMAPQPNPARFAVARHEFARLGFDALVDISEGGANCLTHSQASTLYLSGGDPILFRERLEETGLSRWLRCNATESEPLPVIGASGGAMQLTPNLSIFRLLACSVDAAASQRDSYRGLALTPFEIIPHLGQQPKQLLDAASRYRAASGSVVWGIPDGGGIAYLEGGRIEPLGAAAPWTD